MKLKHKLLEEKALLQSEYISALEKGNTYQIYVLRGKISEIDKVLRWVEE